MIRRLQKLEPPDNNAQLTHKLKTTIHNLKAYFRLPDPNNPETSDGMIDIEISPGNLSCILTLVPPRGDGSIPTINTVQEELDSKRVVYGIDENTIKLCLRTVRENMDIIWQAKIAEAAPPIRPDAGKVKYSTNVIDKTALRSNPGLMNSWPTPLWKPIKAGERIGFLMEPEAGIPGRDVTGRLISPPEGSCIDLGEGVASTDDGQLTAKTSGYVIVSRGRIDVTPLFIMESPSAESLQDFSFSGAVFIRGDIHGNGNIKCDDLFVSGKCEQMKISSSNDIFISGGIVGHHQTEIISDGSIYIPFASEAKLSALGKIVVTNAIINSDVTSADIIRVTSEKGMIVGGKVHSLKEISAATIGSEFGMLTEIAVGKDFLTPARLNDIVERITSHEMNLSRIENLKKEISRAKTPIEKLSQDKQELYLGILRKEETSREELANLIRRKQILETRLTKFITATVKVAGSLYPPSKVQILDAIGNIKEKLDSVRFEYNNHELIISNSDKGTII